MASVKQVRLRAPALVAPAFLLEYSCRLGARKMAGVNKAGLRVVWIRVFAVLASLALGTAAFAQAGSTGGTLGKTDKSVTGISDDIAEPNRKKGSRGVPDSSPRRIESRIAVSSATYGGNCGAP